MSKQVWTSIKVLDARGSDRGEWRSSNTCVHNEKCIGKIVKE